MQQRKSGKKKKKAKTQPQPQVSSDDDDSDSEPSVDNFDLQELEEHLGAALDPKEVEKSPFLRPIEEMMEDHTVSDDL